MYESNDKMVSHPEHYQSKKGIELIDVIEAFTADLTGIEACDTGHIIRYGCRWMNKNGIQDLEKLMWYCQHLIDHLREKEAKEVALSEVETFSSSTTPCICERDPIIDSRIRTKEEIFAGEPNEEIELPDFEVENEEKESK